VVSAPLKTWIGARYELTRRFRADDVLAFAQVSGDTNELHLNEAAAAKSRFKQRVVHGMLTGSLFSTVFSRHFPGAIYVQQDLKFMAPVFFNDIVTARVEILSVEKRTVLCSTTTTKQDGSVVIQGQAKVLVPNLVLLSTPPQTPTTTL